MMKRLFGVLAIMIGLLGSVPAHADEFTGDTKLACEALLCLSTSTRPGECAPSLARYFGINHKKLSDTMNARRSFLQLCPTASENAQMRKARN